MEKVPETIAELTDSPIERLFIQAWATACKPLMGQGWDRVHIWRKGTGVSFGLNNLHDFKEGRFLFLSPQEQIGPYRVDFLVRIVERRGSVHRAIKPWIVIECDGHDFHERTKEQAERDRARDRHFQKLGYVVMRFTGSEICRDAARCVSEVMEIVGRVK